MSEMYGLTVLFLLFILMPVAIILSVAYAIKYVKHEHEWELILECKDTYKVYRCRKCGKAMKYRP